MSQHDMVIDNQGFAATRVDMNGALAALVSNNSGASEPTTKYAYQFWADTTTGILKQRNAANSAWVSVLVLSTGAPVAGVAAGAITSSGLTQATARMLGRSTAGTGAVEQISLGATLELLGGVLAVKAASIGASQLSGAQSGSAPVFGARAWCSFNGATTGTNAPIAGGNVASVTRNGTGSHNINLSTALSGTNYAIAVILRNGIGNVVSYYEDSAFARTTTSFRLHFNTSGVAFDPSLVTVIVLE